MAYLAASSRLVEWFDNLEHAHSTLVASDVILKGQVAELEVATHLLDQKHESFL